MRNTKTIHVEEPPREVIVRELTVGEIRVWLLDLEKSRNNPGDSVTCGLLDDAHLTDIVLMTDLSLADLDAMTPTEIRKLLAACQEINPDFFTVRRRLVLQWVMEDHAAVVATLNAAQGAADTTTPP